MPAKLSRGSVKRPGQAFLIHLKFPLSSEIYGPSRKCAEDSNGVIKALAGCVVLTFGTLAGQRKRPRETAFEELLSSLNHRLSTNKDQMNFLRNPRERRKPFAALLQIQCIHLVPSSVAIIPNSGTTTKEGKHYAVANSVLSRFELIYQFPALRASSSSFHPGRPKT
jgi:hypothetical protein